MLKCGMDPTVPQDSDCANCCIYCKEKESCEYTCPIVMESQTEQDILDSSCEWV